MTRYLPALLAIGCGAAPKQPLSEAQLPALRAVQEAWPSDALACEEPPTVWYEDEDDVSRLCQHPATAGCFHVNANSIMLPQGDACDPQAAPGKECALVHELVHWRQWCVEQQIDWCSDQTCVFGRAHEILQSR